MCALKAGDVMHGMLCIESKLGFCVYCAHVWWNLSARRQNRSPWVVMLRVIINKALLSVCVSAMKQTDSPYSNTQWHKRWAAMDLVRCCRPQQLYVGGILVCACVWMWEYTYASVGTPMLHLLWLVFHCRALELLSCRIYFVTVHQSSPFSPATYFKMYAEFVLEWELNTYQENMEFSRQYCGFHRRVNNLCQGQNLCLSLVWSILISRRLCTQHQLNKVNKTLFFLHKF